MSELFIPGLVAVAAVTLTYAFCVRPMRNGRHCAMPGMNHAEKRPDAAFDAEVQRLRVEVASLHRDISAGRPGVDGPTTEVDPTVKQPHQQGNTPR